MHTFQAAALLVLASHASAAQFTKTSASVGHPFLRYDAFLFDGGSLHDNVHARPYAAKAVEALQAAGKLVIVGSNAPHANDDELAFLQRLGVANLATSLEYAKLNDDVPLVSVFTSGHVARDELRRPSCCYGDRPLVLGASREELGRLHPPGDQIRPVETLDEATCLMAYSSAPTTEDYALAERAGALDMPFLALAGDDRLGGVQGLIAAYLRAGGRRSSIFGKPHPGFFRKAKAVAARHGAAGSLCVVGDSLAQDVEGAKRAGLPVAWLCDGVKETDVAALLAGAPRRQLPDYVIGSLKPPDRLARCDITCD